MYDLVYGSVEWTVKVVLQVPGVVDRTDVKDPPDCPLPENTTSVGGLLRGQEVYTSVVLFRQSLCTVVVSLFIFVVNGFFYL